MLCVADENAVKLDRWITDMSGRTDQKRTTLLVGFDSAWTAHNSGALVGVLRFEDGNFHELGPPKVVDYALDFTALGTVRRSWIKGRCIGSADVEGEYADIYALGWVSHLRTALAGIAVKLGMKDFDLSSMEPAEPRVLTQQVGRIAFELGYAGVFYHSRYGHSIENWAIFEDWTMPDRFPIHQPNSRKVAEDDPDLLEALRILGLVIGD